MVFYHSKRSGLRIPSHGPHFRRNPTAGGGGGFTNTLSIESTRVGTEATATVFQDTTMSPSSRRIGTISGWANNLGLGDQTNTRLVLMAYVSGDFSAFSLPTVSLDYASERLAYTDLIGSFNVFEDLSLQLDEDAWHHFLVQVDTTQATAANRIKIFFDGVELTYDGSSTYPAQNTDLWGFNDAGALYQYWATAEGENSADTNIRYDEIAFFDGQIYGYTDVTSGGLPKDLSGLTFGNTGFWHRFETGVASTVGNDSSGNGMHFANGGALVPVTYAAFVNGDFNADVP